MSRTYDVAWYEQNIADPQTGEPVRFLGGPLAGIDFELDAFYQGVAFENRRRWLDHALRCTLALPLLLSGQEVNVIGHRELDNTAFIPRLLSVWEPHQLPSHMDPGRALAFKLDILRALACIYPSEREVFVHFMDGYQLDEIADLMRWKQENVERTLRRAAAKVRSLCDIDSPARRREGPATYDPWALLHPPKSSVFNGVGRIMPTASIHEAEHAIERVRLHRLSRRAAA